MIREKGFLLYLFIIIVSISFLFVSNLETKKNLVEFSDYESDDTSDQLILNCDRKLKKKHLEDIKEDQMHFRYINQFRKFIQSRSWSSQHSPASFLSLETSMKYQAQSSPSSFFSDSYKSNIRDLPFSGQAEANCWSGSYWPMRHVLIASRYGNDPENNIGYWDPSSQTYNAYTYRKSASFINQPAQFYEAIRTGLDISQLHLSWSSAEKYDLLLWDDEFHLTNWMKYQSSRFARNGDIPSWYGICHGWTIASCYYPEPRRPVDIIAANGKTRIHFYPADIKGLLSQFWANADYRTGFIGTTCPYEDLSRVPRDSATGLYTDSRCSQVDAGAFLVTVANQIGIRRKFMNFDPFQNHEVWNQPLYKYEYKLYNLIDGKIYSTLEDNLTDISSLSSVSNAFLKYVYRYRERNSLYVVGLWINCRYMVENNPSQSDEREINYHDEDSYLAAIYLDRNLNVIGGRWKYNYHPQFAWKAEETVSPKGMNDNYCSQYDGTPDTLRDILEYARESSDYGLPMKCIINYLVQQSR